MFHGSAPLGPIGYVLLQFSKSDVFVESAIEKQIVPR
jgi:hypothetical protein